MDCFTPIKVGWIRPGYVGERTQLTNDRYDHFQPDTLVGKKNDDPFNLYEAVLKALKQDPFTENSVVTLI